MIKMFNLINSLLKRTKIETWESDLLKAIFARLPDEYAVYKQQLDEGLLVGVLLSNYPMPKYVNFTFDSRVSKKYEKEDGRFFRLKGIRFFDRNLGDWRDVDVYVTHGLVCGYCIPKSRKSDPIVTEIDVRGLKKEYLDDYELRTMHTLLSRSEIDLINPSDFYEVLLDGKEYFHVKDLEDGDFIGIDREKNVYRITHDPYEIKILKGGIVENLSKY